MANTAAPATRNRRPNLHAGNCHRCNQRVEAGAGYLAGKIDGRWAVEHGDCDTADTPAAAADRPAFTPTAEQARCVELFATGRDLVIQAGAGTGKTSTLRLLAAEAAKLGKRGTYTAYNKAIVADVKGDMPANVTCATMHSLAFRAVGHAYKHRIGGARQRWDEIARILGVEPFAVPTSDGQTRVLAAGWLAGKVMKAVAKFCGSTDPAPTKRHFEYIEGLDLPTAAGNRTYANNDRVADYLAPFAVKAWADLCDTNGRLRFAHDHYLKMWALDNPVIPGDFIMLDEAQDADPVQAQIIEAQRARGTQVVVVGDECQPTGTLVSVVVEQSKSDRWGGQRPAVIRQIPIEDVRVGDRVVSYNVASRYVHRNGCVVTGITSRPYADTLVKVETSAGQTSRYTPNHHCVARFGEMLDGKHAVYVMRRGDDYRVGTTSGRMVSQGKRLGLVIRAGTEGADAVWLLSVHDSRAEALEAEAVAAWTFGVPDITFTYGGHGMSEDGLVRFWDKAGGNGDQAAALLAAHGRDILYPLWERGGPYLQTRRPFVTRACNLMDGMQMLPLAPAMLADGHAVTRISWTPITVTTEAYTGHVWSMTVEGDHTYVGDGIFTHNCQVLYEWRGAVNAMAEFEASGAEVAFLSQSFRFGPAVADAANALLRRLEARLTITGFDQRASVVGPHDAPEAILCRTNAGAVRKMLDAIAAGRRAHLVGSADQVIAFCRAAQELQAGRSTAHPELSIFDSWPAVQEYVSSDEDGGDLKLMVKLIDEFGAATIQRALETQPAERAADVVISTAHKAKGREWGAVQVAGDFFPPKDGGEMSPAELRLAYVAVTRAKMHLDLSNVPHFAEGWQAAGTAGQRVFGFLPDLDEPDTADEIEGEAPVESVSARTARERLERARAARKAQ